MTTSKSDKPESAGTPSPHKESALEKIENAVMVGIAEVDEVAAGLGLIGALPPTPDILQRRFDAPDEVRTFEKGKFEIVRIGGRAVGRATYEPGWKWSTHVGAKSGKTHCTVEHLGYVISGVATAAFADGRVYELRAGEVFYISPEPHDSWVVGDQPYVSLHFVGADHYAEK